MAAKQAFVIMPIGQGGTPDGEHFATIYSYIKDELKGRGFDCVRADEVQKSGAITKDIINRLAESDLVIADLTMLNPNVYYELGVRHALRALGTLMILDELKTERIPFDLSAYRVIKYRSDLSGVRNLTVGLGQYIDNFDPDRVGDRDNPVHDWYPQLPTNLIVTATTSEPGLLRKTIKELEERLKRYEDSFGPVGADPQPSVSPILTVSNILQDAKDGLLPTALMSRVRQAIEDRDVLVFLENVYVAFERRVQLTPEMFISLIQGAIYLDLPEIQTPIFDHALTLYPSSKILKTAYFAKLAHSPLASDRQQARVELAKVLRLDSITGNLGVPPTDLNMNLLGMMLDAYIADDMFEKSLELTTNLVKVFPDNAKMLRNHARSLEYTGNDEESLIYYRQAVLSQDVDDTAATWLGNEYQRRGDLEGSVEAYSLSCMIDPNDSVNFARLAFALSLKIEKTRHSDGAEADCDMLRSAVRTASQCAFSCPNSSAESIERIKNAFERAEMGELSADLLATPVPRSERSTFARGLYREFVSSKTQDRG